MKALRSFLLVSALLAPLTANAMNFVVAQSDAHPRPQVIGELVALSPIEMIVATPDGRVNLLMDSRTLVPVDLSTGSTIAVEFRVLENGSYYANRVVPFRGTVPAYDADATSAYDRQESTSEPVVASEIRTTTTYSTAANEPSETPAQTYSSSTTASTDEPAASTNADDELPSTASTRPLMGLAGALILATAGTMMVLRRRRIA